jgi:hypothetical protein
VLPFKPPDEEVVSTSNNKVESFLFLPSTVDLVDQLVIFPDLSKVKEEAVKSKEL